MNPSNSKSNEGASEEQKIPNCLSTTNIGMTIGHGKFYAPMTFNVNPSYFSSSIDQPPKKLNESPIWFNVHDPVESFSGRDEFLEKIHNSIQNQLNHKSVTVLSQVKIVSGLGGIGKTETARKYVQKYRQFYHHLIWINSETRDSIEKSFRQLALNELEIDGLTSDGKEKEIEWIMKEVYKKICRSVTLLIFDNAERLRSVKGQSDGAVHPFLPGALPPSLTIPFILVTSRNSRDWGSITNKNVIPLSVFSDDESISFVMEQLELEDNLENQNDARELGQLLGGLPLSLQQSVAYIKYQNEKSSYEDYTIQNYIKNYENELKKIKFLEFSPEDSEVTVYTTWNITFDKIHNSENGQLAISLAECLSFMEAENVPREFLFGIMSDKLSVEKIEESLLLLKKYALIGVHKGVNGTMFSMHRQVQHVIIEGLRVDDRVKDILPELVKSCWWYVKCLEPSAGSFRNALSHLRSFTKKYNLINITKELIVLTQNLALDFKEIGSYDVALEMLEELLESQQKIFGLDHRLTLPTLHQKGVILRNQGKFAEAWKIFESVLENQNKILGPEHPDTLVTLHNMGVWYDKQGKYVEALKMFESVLKIEKKILGPHHLETLSTLNSIAFVLRQQGKLDESFKMYEEILKVQENVLGSQHPETLQTLNEMTLVLYNHGKYDDALKLLKKILKIQKNIVDHHHPSYMSTLGNVAGILLAQDKCDEAMEIFNEIMEIYPILSHSQQQQNPITLYTLNNMASIFLEKGDWDKALKLFRQILEFLDTITINNVKIFYPLKLVVQNNVAFVLQKQGKLNEALKIYEQVLEQHKYIFDINHPQTLAIESNVAFILYELEKYDDALKIFEKVLKHQKNTLGPYHPHT